MTESGRSIWRGRESGQRERERATRVQALFSLPTHRQFYLFQQRIKYYKMSGSKTHLIHNVLYIHKTLTNKLLRP